MEAGGQVAKSESTPTGEVEVIGSQPLPFKKRKFQPKALPQEETQIIDGTNPVLDPTHDDTPQLPQQSQEKDEDGNVNHHIKKQRRHEGDAHIQTEEFCEFANNVNTDPPNEVGGWEEGEAATGGFGEEEEDIEGANLLASLEFVISKSELEEKKGRHLFVSSEGEEIAILLHKGSVYAIENSCPHAGGIFFLFFFFIHLFVFLAALCDGEIEDIEDLDIPYSFPQPPLQPGGVTSFSADSNEPVVVCPVHSFRYVCGALLCLSLT